MDIRLIYTNTCYDAVGRVLIPSQQIFSKLDEMKREGKTEQDRERMPRQ